MIVFDFDGTILSSFHRHEVAMLDATLASGIRLDVSTLIRAKRMGSSNLDWLREKGLSRSEVEKIAQKWLSIIEDDDLLALDHLFVDVPAAIGLTSGQPRVLCTARNNQAGLKRQLREHNLNSSFDFVIRVRPGPGVGLRKAKALSRWEISSFFGDTEEDLTAAKVLGAKPFMVSRGFRSETFWNERGEASYANLELAVSTFVG